MVPWCQVNRSYEVTSMSFSALEHFTDERNLHQLSDVKWVELKKVKQFLYKSGQTLRVPRGCGSQISRQSAHESAKVVIPTHQPLLPIRKYFWYTLVEVTVSAPGPWCERKFFVDEKFQLYHREFEPATFLLVAQCLKPRCVPQGNYIKLN
jgi:hypothetical protein